MPKVPRTTSAVIAALCLGAFAALSLLPSQAVAKESAAGAKAASEARAWKNVQAQVQNAVSSDEVLKALANFVRSYPSGDHASDARFAIAETEFQDGHFARALPHYQLLIDHGDVTYYDDALLRIGEIHYNTKEYPQAEQAWSKLSNRHFSRSVLIAEAMYGVALCRVHDKNMLGATQELLRLIKTYPPYENLAKVRELLGILKFHEKAFGEAVTTLEELDTPPALFYRGLSKFHQKQYLEAARDFKRLETVSSGAYAELGAYLEAECFRLGQNDAMTVKAFDDFTRRYPKSTLRNYAVIHLSHALGKLGKHTQALAALDTIEDAKVSKELRAYALYLQAEGNASLGKIDRSIEYLDAALRLVSPQLPDLFAGIHVAKGYYLLKERKPKEAADSIQAMVHVLPYHNLGTVAYLILGNAAYDTQDWLTAISSYETALLKYKYSNLSDVALTMMLASYYKAGKQQELVTNAARVWKIVSTDFPAQDNRWRAYSDLLLGEAYYNLKLFPEASKALERALKQETIAPQARLSLAWSLFHEGKYDESVKMAQEILSRGESPEPHKASALFLTAASRFNQKNYADAAGTFHDFRNRYRNDALVTEAIFHEGRCYQLLNAYGQALGTWTLLARSYKESAFAQQAQLEIGRLFFQGRKYSTAVKAFTKFLEKWPESSLAPDAQWQLAQSYYNDRKDLEAAAAYREFLNLYPRDNRVEEAKRQLMQAEYRRATTLKDMKLLARFVKDYPKSELAPEAQYQLAQLIYGKRDWPSAVAAFRKLLLDYPSAAQAPLALLAVAHAEEFMKKSDEATHEYKSLMTLFPGSSVALEAAMRLGAIRFHKEQFKEAAECFQFVGEHEAPKDVKADALYNLALAYKKAQDYPQAIKAFEQFANDFEKDKRLIDTMLEVATIYSDSLDQPAQASQAYEQILKHKEFGGAERIEVVNRLAKLELKTGNRKKAIDAYARLITLDPQAEDGRLIGLAKLAALYEEDTSWEKALNVYKAIRQSGGRKDWVKAAVKRIHEIEQFLRAQKAQAKKKD